MRREIGLMLRLLGPALQVVCMVLLLTTSLAQRELAGVRLELLLYGGFMAGFAMVVVGLVLSRGAPRGR